MAINFFSCYLLLRAKGANQCQKKKRGRKVREQNEMKGRALN